MNRFHLLRPVAVLLVAVACVNFPARASGEERAHLLRGTAFLDDFGNVEGAGIATHLGHYTEVGFASISGEVPTALQLEGWVILTAANGDELWETITGKLNFFTGEITATVTFVGGTGRFEDASGSASLVAQIQPDGSITVVVEGKINY